MMKLDFINKNYKKEYKYLENKNYLSRKTVKLKKIYSGYVLPFINNRNSKTKGSGGVLDKKLKYIEISATPRDHLLNDKYDFDISSVKKENSTIVWGGYYINQWGHILIDVLPRFWWITQNDLKYDKIIFTVNNTKVKFNNNFLSLLKLLNIDVNSLEIVYEPKQYKEIIVPELSLYSPNSYTKEYVKLIEYITSKVNENKKFSKKIYLTRTAFKRTKKTEINEKIIEGFFASNSYQIISPEKLNLIEQLSIYKYSNEIVSTSGTIPHNLIFSNENVNWTILNKQAKINKNQIIINAISKANVTFVDSYIQFFPVHGSKGPFWIDFNENLINYSKYKNLLNIKYSKKRKGKLLRTIDLIKYCLLFFRLTDKDGKYSGEINCYTINEEHKIKHNIYFDNREKLGDVYYSYNIIREALIDIYKKTRHYIKKIK